MLVKLIGYETKAFGRIMLPLYAAMLGFALITGLSLRVMPEDFLSGLPGVLLFMLYGILMMSIVVMTCVLSVTRFYKNLLGVEGYLMFSLPTGTGTLIASKVISVILWSAMSTVTAVLAIVLTIPGAGGIGRAHPRRRLDHTHLCGHRHRPSVQRSPDPDERRGPDRFQRDRDDPRQHLREPRRILRPLRLH